MKGEESMRFTNLCRGWNVQTIHLSWLKANEKKVFSVGRLPFVKRTQVLNGPLDLNHTTLPNDILFFNSR